MVPRWRFLATFLRPVFSVSRVQHISDLHPKFAVGHTMCGSMADIQSATAEIRRGKKELEMWANAQRDGRPPNVGGALCSTPQSLATFEVRRVIQRPLYYKTAVGYIS